MITLQLPLLPKFVFALIKKTGLQATATGYFELV